MKQISIYILFLFLAINVKVQGMTLYSTFNTNSTEGNYYGALYFSFSSTNSSDYGYNATSGYGIWHGISDSQTFTDLLSGVQIEVGLVAGLAESPNELNLLVEIGVIDPALGSVQSQLGGYPGNTFSDNEEFGGYYVVGQPSNYPYSYNWSDTASYYSYALNMSGTVTFGITLPYNWDGTSGSDVGSWYFDYTVPPIVSAPEPAVTLQLALGGCCLWLARARKRRRN
jgi:hypothetical protein